MGAPVTVVATFPTPATFSRGLTFDGTNLWVVDGTTRTAYEVDRSDGSTISSFLTPNVTPHGTTWDGTHLRIADEQANAIDRLTTAGAVVSTITDPDPDAHGLAWDGTSLWSVGVPSNDINEINPSTGALISARDPAGIGTMEGVAFRDGDNADHIWVVVGSATTDGLRVISITTATTVTSYDLPAGATDLVFDDHGFLWVIDLDTLYQLSLPTRRLVLGSMSLG